MLTLSIIHSPAFTVAAAFWAAALVVAAVFVKTLPPCGPSLEIEAKDFNSRMAILATAALAVVVLSIILNVSPLLSVALVFLGAIFAYELFTFIGPTWRKAYVCYK